MSVGLGRGQGWGGIWVGVEVGTGLWWGSGSRWGLGLRWVWAGMGGRVWMRYVSKTMCHQS